MSFRILYFSLTIIFALIACEKYEDIAGYQEYFIPKGEHSSKGKTIDELTNTTLAYDVIFDNSCKYDLNSSDQADINKLFGFADCNSNHHNNSARFGWRWNNNQLEILSYYYVNEKRKHEFLTAIELDKPYRMSIEIVDHQYKFEIENVLEAVYYERGNTCNKGLHYLLFPYFGGNQTAPHDMKIYMRRVY